ncbi:MAG TPA: hypothetical protein VJY39_05295 [Acidisphaera sp.]|nr:hypothetical protein [Acidisphaera sp.]
MSDIDLNLPPWFVVLFVIYLNWPIALAVAFGALAASFLVRGWARILLRVIFGLVSVLTVALQVLALFA